MTLQELNAHYELLEDLDNAQEMLATLHSKAQPGAQVLNGMPHSPGVRDRVGELAAEITDMEARISRLQARIAEEETPILDFVTSIENAEISLIIRLRFIRGLRWKEVAAHIGKWKTEASVRNLCYRYIQSQNAK